MATINLTIALRTQARMRSAPDQHSLSDMSRIGERIDRLQKLRKSTARETYTAWQLFSASRKRVNECLQDPGVSHFRRRKLKEGTYVFASTGLDRTSLFPHQKKQAYKSAIKKKNFDVWHLPSYLESHSARAYLDRRLASNVVSAAISAALVDAEGA